MGLCGVPGPQLRGWHSSEQPPRGTGARSQGSVHLAGLGYRQPSPGLNLKPQTNKSSNNNSNNNKKPHQTKNPTKPGMKAGFRQPSPSIQIGDVTSKLLAIVQMQSQEPKPASGSGAPALMRNQRFNGHPGS